MSHRKVCVVGLGAVGGPTADFFRRAGEATYGCDVRPDRFQAWSQDLRGYAADLADLPECDLYVVTVNTGWAGARPDVSAVEEVCRAIVRRVDQAWISLESTVPLGTCERLQAAILDGSSIELFHVPHRWWSEDPDQHGVAQLRVAGAIHPEKLPELVAYYGVLGIPLCPVGDIRVAELSKIAENTDRYIQIAYAELLRMVCTEQGVDFEDLRRAMNSKWNVEVLEARDGIGGTCLPKDILYLQAAAPHLSAFLADAEEVDRLYRERWGKEPPRLQAIASTQRKLSKRQHAEA